MGCFLACFGFNTNKKRRKSRNISSSVEQNHGSYLPLDSDVFIKLDTTEKHSALDSGIIEKAKEASRSKIKKKVSFNLNVEAYEPIHNHEEDINKLYLSDSEEEGEETKWEFNTDTTSLMATLHYAQDSISSRIKSYPQNHRYHNCCTDEIYEDGDDDYELEDDLSSDEDKGDDCGSHENDEKNSVFRENLGLNNEGIGSDLCAKYSKKQVLSVLSPVENLSQWKAVKAKVASVRREKENVELEEYKQNTTKCHPKEEQSFDSCDFRNMKNWKVLRDQRCIGTVAVHDSLSNWLSLT
ncbi:uncharacterized protein [Primulina huaijiensis]|uniref:uncharacterized protein n=1 Tax=Primulina huaijiensis TaxID=1492673 RepID=UPI003CC76997